MARRREGGPHGIAVIDKPAGMTSHDVVAHARRTLGTRKVGHAGTLDPDATGVLVLGVGDATRLLRYVTDGRKSYVGTLVLGVETDTLDASGTVTATHDMSDIGPDRVRAAAQAFQGDIMQVPPMVSALKVGGRRLHELAREGKEVDRPARPVTIYELDVAPTPVSQRFQLTVTCSAGTYIRSLAADIGAALGGGGHLGDLRRTAVGPFTIAQSTPLDSISLLPPAAAVQGLESVTVDAALALRIAHGQVLDRTDLGVAGEGPWAVHDPNQELIAVYRAHGAAAAKPELVLASAASAAGQ